MLVSFDRRNYSQPIMHFKVLTFVCTVLLVLTQPHVAAASVLPEDSSAATIYVYFNVGDGSDSSSLSVENFNEQIEELTSGSYNIIGLPDLLQSKQDDKSLPRRTVALTFDNPDADFFKTVLPKLTEKNLPFAVFISPGELDAASGGIGWEMIRSLSGNSMATIGITSYTYGRVANWDKEKITADVIKAKSRYREELNKEPKYFAYAFGEYAPFYPEIIERQGFSAAFGQTSGAFYNGANAFTLPRFTVTEEFSDLDRLRMTSQALPFPVSDVAPASMLLTENPPFPGFTAAPSLSSADLKNMTCFASGVGQLAVNLLGKNRVEIRFPRKFDEDKGRVNCTLPVKSQEDATDVRWRWLGFLYSVKENISDNAPVTNTGDFSNPEQP